MPGECLKQGVTGGRSGGESVRYSCDVQGPGPGQQLITDADTPERKINVDVVDNAVTLRGTVDTAEAKTEAERIAKETDGVKKVTNQLKVMAAAKSNTNKPAPPAKTKTQ